MFGRTNGPVVELVPSTSCSTMMVFGSAVPWMAIGQAAATLPAAPVTLDRAIEIICRGLAPAR